MQTSFSVVSFSAVSIAADTDGQAFAPSPIKSAMTFGSAVRGVGAGAQKTASFARKSRLTILSYSLSAQTEKTKTHRLFPNTSSYVRQKLSIPAGLCAPSMIIVFPETERI